MISKDLLKKGKELIKPKYIQLGKNSTMKILKEKLRRVLDNEIEEEEKAVEDSKEKKENGDLDADADNEDKVIGIETQNGNENNTGNEKLKIDSDKNTNMSSNQLKTIRLYKPDSLSRNDLFELVYSYTNNFQTYNLIGEEIKELDESLIIVRIF